MEKDVTSSTIAAVVTWGLAKFIASAIVARNKKFMYEKIGTVDQLYLYPMKSASPVTSNEALCTEVGLYQDGARDRQWMVVSEEDSTVIDMKREHRLVLIACRVVKEHRLVLSAPGMPDLELTLNPRLDMANTYVQVYYQQSFRVLHCGPEAARWISAFLGRPAKIVYSCPQLGTRSIYDRQRFWETLAKPGDKAVLSYLAPYLITTSASLDDVNQKLDTAIPMTRFRPNIVIHNTLPFDEDTWIEMIVGEDAHFRFIQPCTRCVITTINEETAKGDNKWQPLNILRRYRCRPPYDKQGPIFGIYMAINSSSHIKVGDPVYALRRRARPLA